MSEANNLKGLLEKRIALYTKLLDNGSKGQNTNLHKLELLWDLEEMLLKEDKKTHESLNNLLFKFGELILQSSNQQIGPGPPLRRLMASALCAFYERAPTKQLFSLADALLAMLTSKTHSLPSKM